MTLTELLESVRRVEVRTNRLVNDTMVGAYLNYFKGRGMEFVPFPLTPALSLGEREKRSQLFGKTTAVSSSKNILQYEIGQRLFPLPKGEGQGEGKGSVYHT